MEIVCDNRYKMDFGEGRARLYGFNGSGIGDGRGVGRGSAGGDGMKKYILPIYYGSEGRGSGDGEGSGYGKGFGGYFN